MEISNERLKELERIEMKMRALEGAGVDNWEGYGIAIERLEKHFEKEEKIEKFFDELCETLCEGVEEPAGHGCGYGFREKSTDKAFKMFKEFVTNTNQAINESE